MDARDFAVLTLDEKRLPGFTRQAFKRRSAVPPGDPRDRALGEALVAGVTKNLKLLDTLIAAWAKRPISQIDNRARLILLVAVAQFRLLDRVPDHALVTEAVYQTRRLGEPGLAKASGFVNAVLREAIRNPDVGDKLPPRENARAYAEVVLSHPRPLVEKLIALLGEKGALQFCEHDNRTPPTLMRLIGNATPESLTSAPDAEAEASDPKLEVTEAKRLKLDPKSDPEAHSRVELNSTEPESEASASASGEMESTEMPDASGEARVFGKSALKVTPHEQAGMVVVEGAKAADYARWAAEGIAQVQDATSAGVVGHLDVQAGMTVLDRCSGVGTKTQQLSELVGEAGKVYAVDAAGARISLLRRMIKQRPSLANVTPKRAEWVAELPEDWPREYDRILIDAPCSNSGVLARRPEARFAQSPESLSELPPLQGKILADTWPLVKGGGLLAYATCSVWPEENDGVVEAFLKAAPDAELVEQRAWLPSFATSDARQYRDGGYVAVLRKR